MTTTTPMYLAGHLAPVADGIDAVRPPELTGPRGVPAGFHGSWIED